VSILLVSEVFPPQKGGSGRWLWELYRRLPDRVTVVAPRVDGAEDFDRTQTIAIDRSLPAFPNWGVLTGGGFGAYRRAFHILAEAVRQQTPTSIHCGKALPEGLLGLLARWRFGVPYCCFVHGEELRLAHTSRDLAWLTRLVLSRATLIVANSRHTSKVLAREWGVTSRLAIMHPGVDVTRFQPAARDAAVRARLGWADRPVVLTVGALQQRKGQDMMIRALPRIRSACPEVLYVIAGEGWEKAYLADLVARNGVHEAVQFLDLPSDQTLIDCYQQCDLFALPNRQVGWDIEGFGIVLLEAQACGKAVVAGRSGGTAEAIDPGLTGELVDCETPEPLAAAVIALLRDPERRNVMGARGREFVTQRFDWPVLEREAIAIFERAFRPRSA
jgi:phosphatidylinositol alpha-1,6-mannosyltransferase